MSQSNYKEELDKLLEALQNSTVVNREVLKHNPSLSPDKTLPETYKELRLRALAAIDRLNASTIGENEDGLKFSKDLLRTPEGQLFTIGRNHLRSELRQAFGVVNTDINVGIKKEDIPHE